MVKYSFVFLIIFSIGLLSIFGQDAATSVVPGWHTTIYTPWFFAIIFQTIWLGIASLIYYILERKGAKVQHRIFLLHTILSMFAFAGNFSVYSDNYYVARTLLIVPHLLFVLGQIVFVIGMLKAKKSSFSAAR